MLIKLPIKIAVLFVDTFRERYSYSSTPEHIYDDDNLFYHELRGQLILENGKHFCNISSLNEDEEIDENLYFSLKITGTPDGLNFSPLYLTKEIKNKDLSIQIKKGLIPTAI